MKIAEKNRCRWTADAMFYCALEMADMGNQEGSQRLAELAIHFYRKAEITAPKLQEILNEILAGYGLKWTATVTPEFAVKVVTNEKENLSPSLDDLLGVRP